jgi:tetratricopeptide (TPR) repeat protein
VLVAGKVPVVVLNACQSGAVGKDLEASVATALLKSGCAAVVAMAYSVYAVAAAEFMAAFYESLFNGASVGQAVCAGRKRLSGRNGRPSPRGDMLLADWLVPVHYLRKDVSFPQARIVRSPAIPSLDAALDQIRASEPEPELEAEQDPLAAVGGVFVGRDGLFYQLETAARLQHVVVLTGPGGTGKSELAKGFARWWRDTGGVDDPRLVCWHSFEPGVASFGLDGVITTLGLQVFGTDFARVDTGRRLDMVKRLLAEHRALLVWDNFETVREMPDPTGATPSLDDDGCMHLREFLDWVRDHSHSVVIITSRAAEGWLGQVHRISVGRLNRQEVAEYADYLLAPFPAAQERRELRSFGELLDWLDGHPLAMRLTLPRLETAGSADLLDGLQGTIPLPAEDVPDADRTTSLSVSIAYSYTHLSEETRRLLPVVSLFHGIADEGLLMLVSAADGVPGRFAGVSKQQWTAVLQDAARTGLVTGPAGGMYQIHPALPGYLAAAWHAENPRGYSQERKACEQALCGACARFGRWLDGQIDSGDAVLAYTMLGLQRRTLGAMLGHALDHRAWEDASGIVRALDDYWDNGGLGAEAAAWADRILDTTTGPGQETPAPGSAAEDLWLYTIIRQATRQQEAGQLEQARRTFQQPLAYLQDQPATEWTRTNLAVIYHQLGNTAYLRRRLDEADGWHRKALTSKEELGDQPGIAKSYHQLGMIAEQRGWLDEAGDWYRKSLTIEENLGDRPGMAATYHQLGMTARQRGRLDEADGWYRKALTIAEELGDRPHMATVYHELGNTAYLRSRLDEAGDWYRKSLTIEENLGDRPGIAVSYGQLGLLAEARQQPSQALDWLVRCVTMFDQFPHPATGPGPEHLARLTHQLGMSALEHAWRQATGQPVPQAVRDYITSHRDEQPGGMP